MSVAATIWRSCLRNGATGAGLRVHDPTQGSAATDCTKGSCNRTQSSHELFTSFSRQQGWKILRADGKSTVENHRPEGELRDDQLKCQKPKTERALWPGPGGCSQAEMVC